MKVLCDVCEKAPATLMCCADEAALCAACDTRVHAANKLANKHQRVPLLTPSPDSPPSCDICQEKTPYFFCLEDRALLCRNCDLSIHSCNSLTSNHRRFLVTGLRVGLHALPSQDVQSVAMCSPNQSSSSRKSLIRTNGSSCEPEHNHTSQPVTGMALASLSMNSTNWLDTSAPSLKKGTESENLNAVAVGDGGKKTSVSDYLMEAIPGWATGDFVSFPEMVSGYNFVDAGSSKADDTPNVWDFDWSADLSILEEQAFGGSFAEVPQIPSPPTASGLWRPTTKFKIKPDLALFSGSQDFSLVPDFGGQSSPTEITSSPLHKRRRTFVEL